MATEIKIVSGGQTGVDRAALDAALESGLDAGGWCPEGRRAEDGRIPERYPLRELRGGGYLQRTRQNVLDSDGTTIICFGHPSGGTQQTVEYCIEQNKPYLLIDADEISAERAVEKIKDFVEHHAITVLNVAGPRASGEPRAYPYTKKAMGLLLQSEQ